MPPAIVLADPARFDMDAAMALTMEDDIRCAFDHSAVPAWALDPRDVPYLCGCFIEIVELQGRAQAAAALCRMLEPDPRLVAAACAAQARGALRGYSSRRILALACLGAEFEAIGTSVAALMWPSATAVQHAMLGRFLVGWDDYVDLVYVSEFGARNASPQWYLRRVLHALSVACVEEVRRRLAEATKADWLALRYWFGDEQEAAESFQIMMGGVRQYTRSLFLPHAPGVSGRQDIESERALMLIEKLRRLAEREALGWKHTRGRHIALTDADVLFYSVVAAMNHRYKALRLAARNGLIDRVQQDTRELQVVDPDDGRRVLKEAGPGTGKRPPVHRSRVSLPKRDNKGVRISLEDALESLIPLNESQDRGHGTWLTFTSDHQLRDMLADAAGVLPPGAAALALDDEPRTKTALARQLGIDRRELFRQEERFRNVYGLRKRGTPAPRYSRWTEASLGQWQTTQWVRLNPASGRSTSSHRLPARILEAQYRASGSALAGLSVSPLGWSLQ